MSMSYVIITPARNEESFIEGTIQSVVMQTCRPLRWIIVSDGSTDKTDEIVRRYCARHEWIELIRMPEHRDRSFAAKVACFISGVQRVSHLDYRVIGNLDADLSFERDYFEYILARFTEMPGLGVAGTPFVEDSKQVYDYNYTNIEHVSGACQLFRRECFEAIGGYVPVREGGIDWIAVTTARMKGWQTRTFAGRVCIHNRKIGTEGRRGHSVWFRLGRKDYLLGWHPLWEFFRALYQMTKQPYLIGGFLLAAGYVGSSIQRVRRPISRELLAFNRREQMLRLRRILSRACRRPYDALSKGNLQLP